VWMVSKGGLIGAMLVILTGLLILAWAPEEWVTGLLFIVGGIVALFAMERQS